MRTIASASAEQIAREFRLQRCGGSVLEAISNPAVRAALELGATVRAARTPIESHGNGPDSKMRAANDRD